MSFSGKLSRHSALRLFHDLLLRSNTNRVSTERSITEP